MKLLILGAGQVGSNLAASLSRERHDITVVDIEPKRLQKLRESYDLQTVLGVGSHPEILERAGAHDADMIIAVTNCDEVNMLACQVAYTTFHTPTKIARVRNLAYLRHPELFSQEALPIDVIISPEQLVTEHVARIIQYPGALQVLDFADGKAQMIAIKVEPGSFLDGLSVHQLADALKDMEFRILAVYRGGESGVLLPGPDTRIRTGDIVFILASTPVIKNLMQTIGKTRRVRRLLLAGGGNIGLRLAAHLQSDYQTKLVEHSTERAETASQLLSNTIVLEGDATDEALLQEENIDRVDVFCALTESDATNIICSMLAKKLGARRVLSLINRATYSTLVQSGVIDILISPQQITISGLLAQVRRGDVVAVHSLLHGSAEAMEAVVHGDRHSSKVAGRAVSEIGLPRNTALGAVVRGGEVLIAHHDTVIESEDHLIFFVADKQRLPELERLFRVDVVFV